MLRAPQFYPDPSAVSWADENQSYFGKISVGDGGNFCSWGKPWRAVISPLHIRMYLD
jgi:hypothetical protein